MSNQIRFNQKIAKEIAQKQFDHTLDCTLGVTDPDYNLGDEFHVYEQNFEEDLKYEYKINPTPAKMEQIGKQYKRLVDKAIKKLKTLYSK